MAQKNYSSMENETIVLLYEICFSLTAIIINQLSHLMKKLFPSKLFGNWCMGPIYVSTWNQNHFIACGMTYATHTRDQTFNQRCSLESSWPKWLMDLFWVEPTKLHDRRLHSYFQRNCQMLTFKHSRMPCWGIATMTLQKSLKPQMTFPNFEAFDHCLFSFRGNEKNTKETCFLCFLKWFK